MSDEIICLAPAMGGVIAGAEASQLNQLRLVFVFRPSQTTLTHINASVNGNSITARLLKAILTI